MWVDGEVEVVNVGCVVLGLGRGESRAMRGLFEGVDVDGDLIGVVLPLVIVVWEIVFDLNLP